MPIYEIGIQRKTDLSSTDLAKILMSITGIKPKSIASSGSLTEVSTFDIDPQIASSIIAAIKAIPGVTKIGTNPPIEGFTEAWSPSDDLELK